MDVAACAAAIVKQGASDAASVEATIRQYINAGLQSAHATVTQNVVQPPGVALTERLAVCVMRIAAQPASVYRNTLISQLTLSISGYSGWELDAAGRALKTTRPAPADDATYRGILISAAQRL
jgi:hypothetical protein